MLICICRQHRGCIVESQGRKRNLVHIKNFMQSFMQLDLSSKCDAFVCYFGANQQHLALTIRWGIKSHHCTVQGVYIGLGFTMGQILKSSLTCLASSPVGLVKKIMCYLNQIYQNLTFWHLTTHIKQDFQDTLHLDSLILEVPCSNRAPLKLRSFLSNQTAWY